MNRLGALASGVLVVVVLWGLPGCQKSAKPKPPGNASSSAQAVSQAEPEKKEARSAGEIIGSAGQNVRQGAARQGNKAMLHDLGVFFQSFHSENGRPPANKDEFITYIKKDAPKTVEALQDEIYIVHWKMPMSSNNVLVYERNALSNGTRLVLKGDGSVHTMTEQEWKEAMKASGR